MKTTMPPNQQRPLPRPGPKTSALELEGADRATFVVDLAKSQIISASPLGFERLGVSPLAALPLTLDDAAPAFQRLRQFAVAKAPLPYNGELVFWIDDRVARLDCSAQPVAGKPGERLVHVTARLDGSITGSVLLPVTAPINLKISDPEFSLHEFAKPEIPAADVVPPPRPRDDAQTLKDIARAIREGGMAARAAAEAAPAPALAQNVAAQTEPDPEQEPVAAEFRQPPEISSSAHHGKLAHELKTPLSAILAAAEIMRDERLGSMGNRRYLGYASDIHDSARHALNVIAKMLDGGAPIAASAPVFEATDLNELARRVVSSMMPLAKGRQLTLELDLEARLPHVVADPVSLRQILINLLSNALKFTPAGGDVHVATGYLDNGAVFLVVRDTGEGMTPNVMARAFDGDLAIADPERNAQRPGGGYGIGLPLVRRLVEANHADIEIDSAPDKGTVVLIAFGPSRLSHL